MGKRLTVIAICTLLLAAPTASMAGSAQSAQSSSWTATVIQENSIAASVLYVPYVFFQIPARIVNGIINPVPLSQSTMPPAVHRKGYR